VVAGVVLITGVTLALLVTLNGFVLWDEAGLDFNRFALGLLFMFREDFIFYL
jgi:hypothetical protein